MKIVFMGTPEFAVPILEALALKYEVVLVVSQPNRVKKKGVLIDTPVAKKAHELGLKLFQPECIKNEAEVFLKIKDAILVTAAYGQYVPTKILNNFKKCLNVHGSLLPKHRGGAPIQRALMEGDSETGVTIMEMTKKLDAGRMYAFKKYKILEDDNATELFAKLSIIGRDLLIESIEAIVEGKLEGEIQNEALASYSSNISPEEEKLSFKENTIDIINKIKGLAYEPGAYIDVAGVKLKVFKAKALELKENKEAGTILCTKKRIVIKTIDGAIELLEVLQPGKKMMSGSAFSNGQKIFHEMDILN